MSDHPLYESCAWHPALTLGPLVSMQSMGVQLQFSLSPQAIMEAKQSKLPLNKAAINLGTILSLGSTSSSSSLAVSLV